jgi:hypothetical protein
LGLVPPTGEPLDTYFSDIVNEVSLDPDSPYVNVRSIGTIAGQAVYSLTSFLSGATQALQIMFSGKVLSRADYSELSLDNDSWFSDGLGVPAVWTEENESWLNFRIVPTPLLTGGHIGGTGPIREGDLTAIHTETRTDPQPEEELSYVMELLAREFARDSDHTDHTFAQTCRNLGRLFWGLVALDDDGELVEGSIEGGQSPADAPTASPPLRGGQKPEGQ